MGDKGHTENLLGIEVPILLRDRPIIPREIDDENRYICIEKGPPKTWLANLEADAYPERAGTNEGEHS